MVDKNLSLAHQGSKGRGQAMKSREIEAQAERVKRPYVVLRKKARTVMYVLGWQLTYLWYLWKLITEEDEIPGRDRPLASAD
jgi:hypothetical protein